MDRSAMRRRALAWQIERLGDQLAALQVLSNRFSWLRLGTCSGGTLVSAGLLATGAFGAALLAFAVTVVAFALVARQHRRIAGGIQRHAAYLRIKRAHEARAALDWAAIPPALVTTARAEYPAELDLDLAGERGLHRLLDTCVSREASLRLRDWLAATIPEPPQIRARQQLVRELEPLVAFRDRLHMNAALSMRSAFRRWEGRQVQVWLAMVLPETRPMRG